MSAILELTELAPPIPALARQSHEGRPTIVRGDSEQTIVASDDIRKSTIDSEVSPETPQSIDGVDIFPPPGTPSGAVSAIEPLAESTRLRRLRMSAAFIALFLAGWKLVFRFMHLTAM
jgi:hypothetical protein